MEEVRAKNKALMALDVPDPVESSSSRTDALAAIERDRLLEHEIHIDKIEAADDVFLHFGTVEQPAKVIGSSVWLDVSAITDTVLQDLNFMRSLAFSDTEYIRYILETLLKRGCRQSEPMRSTQTRLTITELWYDPPRLKKGLPQPEDEPPQPKKKNPWPNAANHGERKPEPPTYVDCTYWLPIANTFSTMAQQAAKSFVFRLNEEFACPYFSVGYKEAELPIETVVHNVAAVSASFLYSRYRLKNATLDLSGERWDHNDMEVVRQYGLTFSREEYTFWCMAPILGQDDEWAGCNMAKVCVSKFLSKQGVEQFMHWINEIHRWGLNVHAVACESDLEACQRATRSPGRLRPAIEGEDTFHI